MEQHRTAVDTQRSNTQTIRRERSPRLCLLCCPTQVTEQLNKARAAVAALQSDVNSATAEPDDDTLDAELAELEKSVPAAEKKLAALKGGKDAMPAAEVDALQRQFNLYLGEWKKRKKGCRELIALVAENAAKSWKEKTFCVRQHNIAHTHTHHTSQHTRNRDRSHRIPPSLPYAVYVRVGGSGH